MGQMRRGIRSATILAVVCLAPVTADAYLVFLCDFKRVSALQKFIDCRLRADKKFAKTRDAEARDAAYAKCGPLILGLWESILRYCPPTIDPSELADDAADATD